MICQLQKMFILLFVIILHKLSREGLRKFIKELKKNVMTQVNFFPAQINSLEEISLPDTLSMILLLSANLQEKNKKAHTMSKCSRKEED